MTTRYIALLAICVAMAMVSLPRPPDSILACTGRELHIAIVGRGNFRLIDPNSSEYRYTRNGSFVVDTVGQLAIKTDGAEWLIDPPFLIPNDWEQLTFQADGCVKILLGGGWCEVGQLQLAVFARTPTFSDPLAANTCTDFVGPPTLHTPGDVAGVLQQGWIEQRPDTFSPIAMRVLLAIIAASVLVRITSIKSVCTCTRPKIE